MARTISTVALAAAVMALSACGADVGESAFVDRVEEAGIYVGDREALVDVGRQTCDGIRAGIEEGVSAEYGEVLADFMATVASPARAAGYDGLDALTIGMASAITFCEDVMEDVTPDELEKNWQEFLDGREGLSVLFPY